MSEVLLVLGALIGLGAIGLLAAWFVYTMAWFAVQFARDRDPFVMLPVSVLLLLLGVGLVALGRIVP